MSKEKSNISLLLYVFCVAAVVIALEITMTRLFSAVLRYHFVFLVISIAICGIGIGGMINALFQRVSKLPLVYVVSGMGWAGMLFAIVFLKFVLPYKPEALWLISLITIIPYIFAGLFFSKIFKENSKNAGVIYAADLCGAGVASFIIVFVLQVFGALNAFLIVTSLLFVINFLRREAVLVTIMSSVLGLVIVGSNFMFNWLEISPMPTKNTGYAKMLFAEMAQNKSTKIVHTVWDAFARTDVVKDAQMGDKVLLVYTNGHVPTRLIHHDKKTGKFALEKNIAEVPFQLRRAERVLCIGPGGGMDALIAKKYGATIVDGIEINPAIRDIVEIPEFKDFYGDLYSKPGCRLIIGDGRTFIERANDKYDMIFMSLAKTATGATGIALVEGYIYTVEAIENYLKKLNDEGMVVFVTDGYIANMRLMLTAIKAFEKQGIPLKQALRHIALIAVPEAQRVRNPYEYALVVSKNDLSAKEGALLQQLTLKNGYIPLFVPGAKIEKTFFPLLAPGSSIESFAQAFYREWLGGVVKQYPELKDKPPVLNIMPTTDDQPFFLDFSFGIPDMLKPLFYITFITWVAIAVIFFMTPLAREAVKTTGLSFGYFSCLGVAFMMVEIPLIQKLILILGHPVYALCVVLFALLLGGGIGSYFTQLKVFNSLSRRNTYVCLAAGIVCLLIAVYLNMPKSVELSLSLPGRVVWAALLSGVMGVFLGMPFPTGIRALGNCDNRLIPWMWGVNGICSVIGSVIAAVGAKIVGFQLVFVCGAMVYFIAVLFSSDHWSVKED